MPCKKCGGKGHNSRTCTKSVLKTPKVEKKQKETKKPKIEKSKKQPIQNKKKVETIDMVNGNYKGETKDNKPHGTGSYTYSNGVYSCLLYTSPSPRD